ncbi:circularly permuted type 2 ATP-grasp protein [Paenibacillus sacheonensis]|uniref:Circularly permuted type 2 ATP-grasp protein n=1 Tax=Paenibacillus sacheonensis TaxID=742054 RepID=A0A7X4YQG6_9BACL|nr:circularly permuted type 2 ATP-grasp protein [Paenibacillus sacheonensis]MBM7565368.1 putative circularly permuted ATP-grasp superfamily protein [Paenibacillus sacheonensis]NBC69704.1 circularly permuted type 2 ATP-grasp protein [Paenibacillus sacheonensis]
MSMAMQSQFHSYDSQSFYDEMFDRDLSVRPHYEGVHRTFARMKPSELAARHAAIQQRMLEEGITFTLYAQNQSEPLERTIPFDYIPRIIPRHEWETVEKGMKQRVKALNAFLRDIYHEQAIVQDGIIPRAMIVGNKYFRPEMAGLHVPQNVYMTTSGIDLIRDEEGRYFVLEDNLRTPSGFSYLYKGRGLMTELFSELYLSSAVSDIERSLNVFLRSLRSLAPSGKRNPLIVLLTPGAYNSAYFEHAFLAQQMGIHLVEGRDLVYKDHKIYLRELSGLRQVDVIYRRLDDDYLDPLAFQGDSLLGVPGLMNAYRAGNVAIANAPGTGVADDKAIYAYVPEMIRYYLNEEPILHNVPTYILSRKEDREYALAHLDQLVVKETSLSGGYGMLIGPAATQKEIHAFADAIQRDPGRYIAQTTMKLSRAPVMLGGAMQPRHIDLRVFVLMGDSQMHVIPGGLTRVALQEGSLVVNSSQGGGVKDTWVLSR